MPSTKDLTWDDPELNEDFENFVGRNEKLNTFRENFTGDRPKWMVLSITGEGGVGKSTLLNQFSRMAKTNEIEVNTVKCDDHQMNPVEVMGFVADQLAKLKVKNREFDERHAKYRQLREQAEKDPNVPRGLLDLGAHFVTDVAVDAASRVPGLGSMGNDNFKKVAGDVVSEAGQYVLSRWSNKDEVQLLREPEKTLTPLFIKLLNEAVSEKPLVVMLDVFERTGKSLSLWLLELFTFRYGKISAWVSFVLSGRDSLDQRWTELGKRLVRLALEPFELKETREYLINRNITDEILIEQIYKDTGGLPVLVELLAATNPQPGQPLPDISKDAVDRFLLWTPKEMRKLALLAAIPRQFNQDILSSLLGDEAENQFNWLIDQSYVRSDTERGWYYHEKVRELMLRYQMHESHIKLSKNQKVLAEYYAKIQSDLNLDSVDAYENAQWRRLELERVYHLFSVAPEKNYTNLLNAFLAAFLYRWRLARAIERVAEQVFQENKATSLKDNLEILGNLIVAHEKNDYQQATSLLNQLQDLKKLNNLAKVAIEYRQGGYFRLLGKFDNALANLNQAIALNDSLAWAFAARGETYRALKKYDEALTDLSIAIALDNRFVWAIANRGLTYFYAGKYDNALSDFTYAIELA